MPWKSLEVSRTELGIIRLAGEEVDLFRLWRLVTQDAGGEGVRVHHLFVPHTPAFMTAHG